MELYSIIVTYEDDTSNFMTGVDQVEMLNIVLNETLQNEVVWFKIEREG